MDRSLFRGSYKPYVSPRDPCPPILVKTFVLPPQLFTNFQKPGLPQYSPEQALKHGSLWPSFVDGFYSEEGIS
ncbi:spore coat associated protein CotJA [Psychrobacillus vulpis]|uniref:Spore coat associated protein CotJA n=1 Tax=Psychrobacillus vulpis TaxID=2325572 RepID=A0A544TSH0_9BACI|nr:spore coat associated protein CotJA [Psychrobacillus vulpis]TQR20392.1 spore coat associated protein CotJA [Psychrobacillus vulpis]